MIRRPVRAAVAAAALCALVTPLLMGAAVPTAVRPALCIPLIWCPTPTPSPTPTPTPTTPGTGAQPGVPLPLPGDSGTQTPDAGQPTQPAPDASTTVFTKTPAQMASKGLSFTGLKSIGLVTVPTVDGDRIRVLKISADTITITGFSLSVRPPEHDGLVTDADTMSLKGDVTVYLGSLTATGQDGQTLLTFGLDTPPSLDDVEPGLLHVQMGLVGTIADSISYTNTDQRMVAKK
ncbi:hypothetical protein [Microbacterium arabinogalactanolyticum]|uniref:Uncharacterized protein n=1 Tax=Microbacterium arabinogalactanolyticum TaxID=69365 RepID=A0ABQ5NCW4_9MICO|nr:hypothetical protein [Microbacterium arabinogalactanolyticum]GLC83630.1 hypothetical protein MIAR_02180 [Microbacterium arabinogalactanolyticum]